ncbi:hemophore [Mycobacterium sp. C31M]
MTFLISRTAPIRRGLTAVFAGCLIGGAAGAVALAPSAVAETDPCEASEIAKTIGSVATSMGDYLDTHPDTNQALTAIAAQPAGPQSLAAAKTYFDAKPGAARDIQKLQAPLVKLTTQCNLPISLPQVLGLMQAVQTPAAGLPTAGLPAGAAAAAESVASVAQGAGPLPGPVLRAIP